MTKQGCCSPPYGLGKDIAGLIPTGSDIALTHDRDPSGGSQANIMLHVQLVPPQRYATEVAINGHHSVHSAHPALIHPGQKPANGVHGPIPKITALPIYIPYLASAQANTEYQTHQAPAKLNIQFTKQEDQRLIGYILHSGHKCHRMKTGYQTSLLHTRSEKGHQTHTKTSTGTQPLRQSHHGYEENAQLKRRKKGCEKDSPTSLPLDAMLSRIAVERKVKGKVSIIKNYTKKEKLHDMPYEMPRYLSLYCQNTRPIHELHTQDFSLYPNEK